MIYVAQPTHGGPIKIGYSHNAENRVPLLRCYSPYNVEMLCQFEGDRADEIFLHMCFAPTAFDGRREWYRPTHAIWRFIIDVMDNGRPDYMVEGEPKGMTRKQMAREFGGWQQCCIAMGYSPNTIPVPFATNNVAGRLKFARAFRDRILPDYIMALHDAPPSVMAAE